MLEIVGEVALRIENLKPGNEITKTMPSGTLVIGETATPFVLQRKAWGNIKKLNTNQPEQVKLACFKQRTTAFTKQGYVSFLLTSQHVQCYLYIKKEWLKDFYAAFCMMASVSSVSIR